MRGSVASFGEQNAFLIVRWMILYFGGVITYKFIHVRVTGGEVKSILLIPKSPSS